eukprot:8795761-Pyramimonas_sp.AAC.1
MGGVYMNTSAPLLCAQNKSQKKAAGICSLPSCDWLRRRAYALFPRAIGCGAGWFGKSLPGWRSAGHRVDAYSVEAKGYSVEAVSYHVDVKGYMVDAKGYRGWQIYRDGEVRATLLHI